MNKKFKLFFILKLIGFTASVTLDCHEGHRHFGLPGVYSCVVNGNLTVSNDDEKFIVDSEIKNKTIIVGFVAEQKEIHYIPRGLSSYLPELKNVMIKSSSLKEVTSKNLKELPNLIYLDLSFNHIKSLEKDVFQYNHKLNDIRLNNNLIFAIESGVFDQLKSSRGSLKILHLHGNDCQFSDAQNRSQVIDLLKTIDIKCWNQTSKMKNDIYRSQKKLEKLEGQLISLNDNHRNTNKSLLILERQTQSIQNESQSSNESYFKHLDILNKSLNERIKRSMDDINEAMDKNSSMIHDFLKQINSSQTALLNDILSKVNDISTINIKVNSLDNKLDNMKQELSSDLHSHNADIKSLLDKMSSFLLNLKAINTDSKLSISYCASNDSSLNLSSITAEYLNTVLLLIIIAFQAINLCCKSRPKPKTNKLKSRSFTAPPSLEPVYYTTATQLVDDYPKGSRRQKNYESYADIQSCDFVSTSEKQNNSNEVITSVQAEVEYQGFSNEIYGTVSASSEDLYSEVISPKGLESKDELNDDSAIYAVVEKRKEGDGWVF